MNILAKLLGRATAETLTWQEPDELSALLTGPSPPLIIDVRGPAEFTGALGHIAAARNIPLDQIPSQTVGLLSEARPVVLVCHTDRRSSAAAEHLQRAGGTNIAVLRGGMVAWRARSPL
jgi:rhodanese-related sulfurtransferase